MKDSRAPSKNPISVIIADGDRMAGGLLSDLLKRHSRISISACVVDSDSLLRAAKETNADVALISADLEDGPMSGLASLRRVREENPKLRVVVLLNRSRAELVVDALRSGARGIFSRAHFTSASLLRCVQRVYDGEIWLNNDEKHYLFSALNFMYQPRLVDSHGANLLSNREEEVIRMVAEGRGNREIATRLKLSEHTVKNYLFRIFDKLGISTRVELMLYAMSERKKTQLPFPRKPTLRVIETAQPELTSRF
ncbi:MAG TPA: response regulator transcription factor [Terriglobales bacterium]|nr:response regulator transcription factor [Terriglobales bacterium]